MPKIRLNWKVVYFTLLNCTPVRERTWFAGYIQAQCCHVKGVREPNKGRTRESENSASDTNYLLDPTNRPYLLSVPTSSPASVILRCRPSTPECRFPTPTDVHCLLHSRAQTDPFHHPGVKITTTGNGALRHNMVGMTPMRNRSMAILC